MTCQACTLSRTDSNGYTFLYSSITIHAHTHSGRERKEWLTQGNMGVEDSERGRNAEQTGEAQETGRAEEAEDGVVVGGSGSQL